MFYPLPPHPMTKENKSVVPGDLQIVTARVEGVATQLGQLERKVDKLDARVGVLDEKVDKLDARVGKLDENVEKLDVKVEACKAEMVRHFDVVAENLRHDVLGALNDLANLFRDLRANHETRIRRLERHVGLTV